MEDFNPWLEADAERFGHEEAVRMHALGLGTSGPGQGSFRCDPDESLGMAPVRLATFTLRLMGPQQPTSPEFLEEFGGWLSEAEENLNDLLPEGYYVKIDEGTT